LIIRQSIGENQTTTQSDGKQGRNHLFDIHINDAGDWSIMPIRLYGLLCFGLFWGKKAA
jgi:hypothetical protein